MGYKADKTEKDNVASAVYRPWRPRRPIPSILGETARNCYKESVEGHNEP